MRPSLGRGNPGWSCMLPELVCCKYDTIFEEGGHRREVWVEVCSQGLQTQTLFKTCSLFANLFETGDFIFLCFFFACIIKSHFEINIMGLKSTADICLDQCQRVNRLPVSSVGRVLDCCVGGLGFEPQTGQHSGS